MSVRLRVAWIDPKGKSHLLFVDDMQDAAKQISELRKALGFPEPNKDTILAAVSITNDSRVTKGTIDIKDLPDEIQKDFHEKLSDTLDKANKKGLD
jgi:hypothetical protein